MKSLNIHVITDLYIMLKMSGDSLMHFYEQIIKYGNIFTLASQSQYWCQIGLFWSVGTQLCFGYGCAAQRAENEGL